MAPKGLEMSQKWTKCAKIAGFGHFYKIESFVLDTNGFE